MAAIIELALPPDEFAIETTLATLSDVEVDIERVVATNPEQITPYVWVRTDDFEAFEAAVRDDPTVDGMTLLSETETGNERVYQMTWIGSIDLAVELLTEHQGTITHAEGSDKGWHLRVVFPDRATLSQAYDAIREAGFQAEAQVIYGAEDTRHIRHGLTDKQRNVLVAAVEMGYFDIPRRITLAELADKQELSHQALSERIRRATTQIIESTLLAETEDDT